MSRIKIVGTSDESVKESVRLTQHMLEVVGAQSFTTSLNDIRKGLSYNTYRRFLKFNCHIGQRKLLLNEIEFLTRYAKGGPSIMCYVGAAPCEHLTILLAMFPEMRFLLVDPNFCIIDTPHQCYVYQNPDIISQSARGIVQTYARGHTHQKRGVNYLQIMPLLGADGVHNMLLRDVESAAYQKDHMDRTFGSGFSSLAHAINQPHQSTRIFIIQDYMSIDLANMLAGVLKGQVFFASDLRTNLFGPNPLDLDILLNDLLQMSVIDIMRPVMSMLKFHPPFFGKDDPTRELLLSSDALESLRVKFPQIAYVTSVCGYDPVAAYLSGKYYQFKAKDVLIQPWAPPGSSEARLVITKASISRKILEEYLADDWENRCMTVRMLRTYKPFDLFEKELRDGLSKLRYDQCFDCTLELSILSEYLEASKKILRKGTQPSLAKLIQSINKKLRYNLATNLSSKCSIHGFMRTAVENHANSHVFIKLPDSAIHRVTLSGPSRGVIRVLDPSAQAFLFVAHDKVPTRMARRFYEYFLQTSCQ
jgi:hypothetical protein